MPLGIGPMEIVIVLVIALVVLGPKRLPATARSVGRSMREFKGAITGSEDQRSEPDALPRARPSA
jgi:sec-independent protein translocase protein TatA